MTLKLDQPKEAKQIGLTIPAQVLAQADQVIQLATGMSPGQQC